MMNVHVFVCEFQENRKKEKNSRGNLMAIYLIIVWMVLLYLQSNYSYLIQDRVDILYADCSVLSFLIRNCILWYFKFSLHAPKC